MFLAYIYSSWRAGKPKILRGKPKTLRGEAKTLRGKPKPCGGSPKPCGEGQNLAGEGQNLAGEAKTLRGKQNIERDKTFDTVIEYAGSASVDLIPLKAGRVQSGVNTNMQKSSKTHYT
jgi:hypothetical protein